MEKSSRRLAIAIGIFAFIFIASFVFYGVKSYMIRAFMKNFKEPPVTVSATKVTATTWHPSLQSAGTLKASNGVDVNAQVNGIVTGIFFESGKHVKQGEQLLQLDDSVDQQTLLRDQAALRFDKIDYDRKQALLRRNAVAQNAVDAAKAAYLQAAAAVQSDEVMIAQKKICAPFAGRLGIRQVNLGQYITPSVNIVTLQALNPLFVDFSLPEQNLPLLKIGQSITLQVDAYPNQVFQGKVSALNSAVDINTRTIAVRAAVPNPKEILYPGLFASVQVRLPPVENVMTVPQTAVAYSLYGDSVYVLSPQDKKTGLYTANQKYVTVGDREENWAAITKGVQAGELIVTSGQLKLHPGATVIINDHVKLQ